MPFGFLLWRGFNISSHENAWSWIVCFSATLCNALHFGITLSFGVLLPYLLGHFNASLEQTALVGSLALAVTFAASLLASRLVDIFGCRLISILGGIISALGLAITSFSKSIYMLYCTYSLTFGIGASFIFTSAFLVIPRHFRRRRSLAVGIISAGGGVGCLAFGPIIQICLDSFGWPNTCRILAAAISISCVLSLIYDSKEDMIHTPAEIEILHSGDCKTETVVRIPTKMAQPKSRLLDWSVWKHPAFSVHTIALTLACVGHYTPQVFLVKYSESLGVSPITASRLFIYIGISTIVARMLVGVVCDQGWLSASTVNQLAKTLSGVMSIALPFTSRYSDLVIVSVLYGLADGGLMCTLNFLLMDNVPPSKLSSAFGFGSITTSVAVAVGSPLAGLLEDISGSSDLAFFTSGGVVIMSAIVPLVLFCLPCTPNKHCISSEREEIILEDTKEETV